MSPRETLSERALSDLQWNPSKVDTLGPPHFVHYSEVSFMEGFCLIINQKSNTIVFYAIPCPCQSLKFYLDNFYTMITAFRVRIRKHCAHAYEHIIFSGPIIRIY